MGVLHRRKDRWRRRREGGGAIGPGSLLLLRTEADEKGGGGGERRLIDIFLKLSSLSLFLFFVGLFATNERTFSPPSVRSGGEMG